MLRTACTQPDSAHKLQDLLNQLSSSGLVSQVSVLMTVLMRCSPLLLICMPMHTTQV